MSTHQESSSKSLPLQGIRVLDLTTFLSGPSATQLLADLGADVIKVEPLSGDSSRSIPPHFIGPDSAYYLANNRNKSSIAVDLKTAAGRAVVTDLIARSDVFIENFRPGVCDRLGLRKEELCTRHPDLIWASISGFGQSGPFKDRPAYDMIVQAMSGVMSLTGQPGGPAARLGIPAGDVVAGMYAVIAILAALLARAQGAQGRVIDVSMLDAQMAQLSYQAVYTTVSGKAPGRQGASHDSIPTYRTFRDSNGDEFVVTANTQAMWERLTKVVGRAFLAEDPRFKTEASRFKHKLALWEILEPAFAEASADEWVRRLVAAEIPAAPVLDVLQSIQQARESGRGTVALIAGEGGSFEGIATPIVFENTKAQPRRYPPRLGEQTLSILREALGMPEDQIRTLLASGAAQVAQPHST